MTYTGFIFSYLEKRGGFLYISKELFLKGLYRKKHIFINMTEIKRGYAK